MEEELLSATVFVPGNDPLLKLCHLPPGRTNQATTVLPGVFQCVLTSFQRYNGRKPSVGGMLNESESPCGKARPAIHAVECSQTHCGLLHGESRSLRGRAAGAFRDLRAPRVRIREIIQ